MKNPPSTRTTADNAELQRELEHFQARLELALDAGRMGAWQFDGGTGRVTWTPTLELIHGLEVGTLGGTFEDYQRDIHPDDRKYVLDTIARSLTGQSPHQLSYRIIRPDGEVRWLEAAGKLLGNGKDGQMQMMGVCCDVTDRVIGEQQRQQLLQRAEEAVRARDDLLAMVSHDLRGPLQVVSICAQAILNRASHRLDTEDARRIGRAVEQMSDLIANLLDAASIESGSFRVVPTHVNLHTLVDASVDASLPLASQKGIIIDVQCDPGVEISCDGPRIGQVMANLLGNAIKFAPNESLVTVSARLDDERCIVVVTDQGPGIPDENRELVFERYWHGKQSGRAGSGLGLYISRGIVRAHGGDLHVESVLGQGSSFTFWIPCS